jgi:hypothetical protein
VTVAVQVMGNEKKYSRASLHGSATGYGGPQTMGFSGRTCYHERGPTTPYERGKRTSPKAFLIFNFLMGTFGHAVGNN